MKRKNTDKLLEELKFVDSMKTFIEINELELKGVTLAEYLKKLIEDRGLSKAEIVKSSCLEEAYAYHIFSGKKNPSKVKVLAIAIAMRLDLKETQYLLKAAKVGELYARNMWDSAIIYAINKKLNVIQTNVMLESLSIKPYIG